ncbi:hypothetical protein TFLX_02923 [Thermoflexales bacterium]|nr:hypothetical protein TFLX_02923 [Thermoflexales bacterium]
MNKPSINEETHEDSFFIEAVHNAEDGTVAIFGNAQGLSYLRDLIDGLVQNGIEHDHYYLERHSGLDGNVALILGRASKPTPLTEKSASGTGEQIDQDGELPQDIPAEVIVLVNEGKPLEAIRAFIKARKISLDEARKIVSVLYSVQRAGLILTPQNRLG